MPRDRRTYWLYPDLDNRTARQRRRSLFTTDGRYTGRMLHNQVRDMHQVHKDQANLVSSNVRGKPGYHMPVIDLDLPCKLVESSTPDHYHLYIEKEVTEENYWKLLDALADCGIVEHGYVEASKVKGGTFVRPPGVFKPWVMKKLREEVQEREAANGPSTAA